MGGVIGGVRVGAKLQRWGQGRGEVGGDAEGSSLGIWELQLTPRGGRRMLQLGRAAQQKLRGSTRRGAWDAGEKREMDCRFAGIDRKREPPEDVIQRHCYSIWGRGRGKRRKGSEAVP